MDFYEKLPVEFLIRFYNEIIKNIEKGIITKTMYYELGVIISVASRRGFSLEFPSDFNQIINQQVLNDLLQYKQVNNSPCSA
ncbi:hypothetical protein [Bacillus sp. EB600]|uniref:hypothetical protein n=1 Tax=Bacillus sp. EB600 TaxID=2806345 RepID=UPI00210C86EA|nr:hypothetical protein [Bacillus sp. EB600]MCQ6282480.1 hypothetical protein [Bacillus sp. EB600]